MSRAWRYLAVGVVAYLLVLLATFPAARLVSTVEKRVDGLSLRGVEGTLFSGSAAQMLLSGTDLGSAQWSLRPWRMFAGKLEYDVDLDHPEYSGSTRLGLTITGGTYGSQLEATLDPSALLSRFAQLPVLASGALHLRLYRFAPGDDGLPGQLSGQLAWQDGALSSPLALPLGDVAFDLERVAAGIEARVSAGGALGAGGTVMLTAAGDYRADLRLRPGNGVNADVLGLLDTVSRRQQDGSFQIRTAGKLRAP